MPRNIRFTTRRLFFISAAFALSFATVPGYRDSTSQDWPAFFLSLISFLAVFGLCQQLKDIRHLARERPHARDDRFALQLAMLWRAALLVTLVVCYALAVLVQRGIIDVDFRVMRDSPYDYGDLFPDVAWSLLVFVTLAAIPGALASRRGQFVLPTVRRGIGWLLAFALVAVVLCDMTVIYYLVHLATAGIEAHQPLQFQRRGTFPEHAREDFAFFWISCCAAACVALNLLALAGTAHAVRRGSRWRWPALIVLIVGLTATTGYAIWYIYRELPRVSPDMAAVNLPLNWAGTVFLAGTVLTIAFILARSLAAGARGETQTGLRWRRSNGYLHECRATPLLALILAVYELAFLYDPLRGFLFLHFGDGLRELILLGSIHGLVRAAGMALHWPTTYLWLAMGLLGLRLVFRRKAIEQAHDESPLHPIAPTRFAVFFLLTVWLVGSGLVTLSAFAFAWWLGPWFR